jgi:hypothetical protein
VNGFILDDDTNHIRILTTGTHDKAFMKAVAKKFPKTLLGLPWTVDYKIRVPMSTDLDISAGRGPITSERIGKELAPRGCRSSCSFRRD